MNLESPGGRGLECDRGEAAGVGGRAHRHRVRTVGGGAEIEVLVGCRDDIEGTARAELDDRGQGPVAEEMAPEARTGLFALVNAAEDEAMALVKRGVGPFQVRTEIVLRGKQ